MRRPTLHGITLLETVLYIGLMMIILPSMVTFVLQLHGEELLFDARTRMEQTAGMVFSELQIALTASDAVTTSTSTLGANPSTLRFQDASGTTVVIDCPTVAVSFPGGTQNVRRLRMQTGAGPAVWLTDGEIDVTTWQVSTVRDSSGILTGLRISLDTAMVAPTTDALRSATFSGDTTIALSPHTIEN